MTGLVLSDDLLFTSKITGTAAALGLSVRVARTPTALLELAAKEPPGGVLIDLHHPGLDLKSLLAALRDRVAGVGALADPGVSQGLDPGHPERRPRVVAYGSHVEADTLRAAREAGCDLVLPRSKFVERLPHDLAGWLA